MIVTRVVVNVLSLGREMALRLTVN